MNRSNLKSVICAFIFGIFLSLNVAVVFAATASSPYKYYGPIFGYKYKNNTTIISDSNGARSNAGVYSDGSGNIPVGYMAVAAALINSSNGAIVRNTEVIYNSSSCVGLAVTTSSTKTNGTYCGQGFSAAYNGEGEYHYYNAYDSPRLSYP